VKNVPQINLERAVRLMTPEESTRHHRCSYFFTPEFLRTIRRSERRQNIDLTENDLMALRTSCIIETTTSTRPWTCPVMHVFTVPEPMKKRRRAILHTVDINDQTYPDTADGEIGVEVQHTPLHRLIDTHVEEIFFTITLDAAAYYNQFPLPKASREFFKFTAGGETYRLLTIPTGQRHCVALAEYFSRFLIRETLSRLQDQYNLQLYGWDTYIDNFLFYDRSEETLKRTVELFYEVCTELQVTLNEVHPPAAQRTFEFRGIEFGLDAAGQRYARPSEKTRRKLVGALDDLKRSDHSIRDCLAIFGLSIYASSIVGAQTHQFYHVFKFVRRRATQTDLDQDASLWPSIVPEWRQWIETLLEASRKPNQKGNEETYTVYSDASLTGYGHVIFHNGLCVDAGGGQWEAQQQKYHINILEALALVRAIRRTPPAAVCHCVVDNTTVMYSVAKGRSRNYLLNQITGTVIGGSRRITSISYIHTADNPADAWSRGQLPSAKTLGLGSAVKRPLC
jgi:hypothetical protein